MRGSTSAPAPCWRCRCETGADSSAGGGRVVTTSARAALFDASVAVRLLLRLEPKGRIIGRLRRSQDGHSGPVAPTADAEQDQEDDGRERPEDDGVREEDEPAVAPPDVRAPDLFQLRQREPVRPPERGLQRALCLPTFEQQRDPPLSAVLREVLDRARREEVRDARLR